jgi:hypothetical protein
MLSFLAELCEETVSGSCGVGHKHQRAVCAWGMSEMIHVMDASPRFMSAEQVEAFTSGWEAFSVAYQALAAEAQAHKQCLWKFRPKIHDLCHLAMLVKKYGINPRHRSCFGDEDLMGKLARTGRQTHRGTMSLGLLRRHMLRLCVRWSQRARDSSWQVP